MSKGLSARLFAIFTGALIGYIFGWIWGWSLFDPNSDVWALAAFVGAVVGLVMGIFLTDWRFAGIFIGASLGLYIGWVVRTWLFGDVPGGWGVGVMIVGMLVGGRIGVWSVMRQQETRLGALLGAVYVGLFGGFLIDVVILDILTGWVSEHTIMGQAPAVVLCGIAGGLLGGRVGRSRGAARRLEGQAGG